ncbi:hypothetical Protein YC6258_00765 [Gynuella sunshinyii YC6258]|uniref:Uncharacterized protein n=1 Tax=Gynuella sunshinyii YC6258 TaxID=1445510 RepID=A0A0C5UZU4_9GAMM|nr:hypothetical Protein YC6258_00765 [Gynuella sunshinyii YC6258]
MVFAQPIIYLETSSAQVFSLVISVERNVNGSVRSALDLNQAITFPTDFPVDFVFQLSFKGFDD